MSIINNKINNAKSPLPSFLRNTDSAGKKIAMSEIKNIATQVVKDQGISDTKDYILVYLHSSDSVCVMGSCDFCLYAGSISVHGLTLRKPNAQFYAINSPPHSSSLLFYPHDKNEHDNKHHNTMLKNDKAKEILPSNIILSIEKLIQSNSNDGSNSIQEGGTSINQSFSVLIFKENKATIGLNKAVEARSWFQRNLLSNYSNTTSIMHGFALMLPTNQETNRKTITKYVVAMPQLWEASVNTILTSVASSTMKGKQIHNNIDKGNTTVVLCGAKNVGKSTLGRYVVNRFLSYYQKPLKGGNVNTTTTTTDTTMDSDSRGMTALKSVAYIDTDLGQTEFTPPGFVSLFLLKQFEPMLGPAMPFWRQPILSYYIGDVTPRSFPDLYVAAVQNLIKKYHELKFQHESKMNGQLLPLVLNTMGWVKGLGLDLLNQIIAFSQPKHILQIVGNSEKKRFALSIPQEQRQQQQSAVNNHNIQGINRNYNIRIHQLQSRAGNKTPQNNNNNTNNNISNNNNTTNNNNNNNSSSSKKNNNNNNNNNKSKNRTHVPLRTARELREEQICAYFSYVENDFNLDFSNRVCGDIVEHLVNQRPYKVNWNCIAISFQFDCGDEIDTLNGKDLFDALNGTLVGLGILDQVDLSSSKSIMRLKGSPLCKSIGLGIIRGIDYEREIYYILSPVPERMLRNVNVFIRGKLNSPVKMIQWRSCPIEVPYLSSETLQPRSQQKSNVRGMKRRRLNQ